MEKYMYQKVKLGIFVISAILLFITGIYLIGKKQNMFGNTVEIFAVFNDINGLKEGNNVRYSGINVGTVNNITMITDTTIIVKIKIQRDITKHIRKDAKCAITSDGLVGSMIINILPGSSENRLHISPGDTLLSYSRLRTDEMLSTLSITNENAALLTSELLKLVKEIGTGKGVVGAIIQDSMITQNVKTILFNLRKTTDATTMTVLQLNQLLSSLDRPNNLVGTFRDTTLSPRIKNMIINLEKSSAEIRDVLKKLDVAAQNTNQTILNAKDGEGALNYLSNNPSLVRKLDTTMVNLDSAIYQINKAGILMNENLEALKTTWLLRKYFKKLEKEKEREK